MNGVNLRATAPFHAYLRAVTTVIDCHERLPAADCQQNVPIGTHWESQLVIRRMNGDPNATPPIGQEVVAAWDVRRMRGRDNGYRQNERFANVLANLAAGDYAYYQRVRIVDNQPGTMTFETQWTTGLGVPSQYPVGGGSFAGQQTISSTWTAVGVPIDFHNNVPVELSIVGTGHIVSGSAGQTVDIALVVDGPPSESDFKRFGRQPIASADQLPDGFTAIDTWLTPITVLPNNQMHHVQMYMRVPSGAAAVVENATVNFVGYPVSSPLACPQEEIRASANLPDSVTSTTLVDETTMTIGDGGELADGCGTYKKALEVDIPGGQDNVHDALLNGYIELLGNVTGSNQPRGELFIKAQLLDSNKNPTGEPSTDLGIIGFWSPSSTEGMWFSTDGIWSNCEAYQRLTLYVRKVTCEGGNGTFDIGKRWLTLKFLPSMTQCAGTPAEQCHYYLYQTQTTTNVTYTPPIFPASGGSDSFRVHTTSERPDNERNCWWRASSLSPYITVDNSGHQNDGVLTYTVAPNTGLARTLLLNVAGRPELNIGGTTLQIKQQCGGHCRATRLQVSAPSTATAGLPVSLTVTAFDENNQVLTAYDGTVTFSSSDSAATLPGSYTFTAGDNGTHTLQATLRSANSQTIATAESGGTATGSAVVNVTVPLPPANVQASFDGSHTVTITWNSVTGADEYHVYRFTDIAAPSTSPILIVKAPQLGATDSTVGVGPAHPGSNGNCYLYAVKTYANGVESTFGQFDYAPTFTFTDPTITANVTFIRGVHFAELRYVIDTIRRSADLTAAWSSYDALTGPVLAAYQTSTDPNNLGLRPALDAARARFGKPAWVYTYSTAAGSIIRAADIAEVRAASQ